MDKWIPCSERLPDNIGHYLVTLHTYGNIGFTLDEIELKIMYFGTEGWNKPVHCPEWINEKLTQDVLAWMPLPEPFEPQESEDNNNAISLSEVLENIKTEINELSELNHANAEYEDCKRDVLEILNKYISGKDNNAEVN